MEATTAHSGANNGVAPLGDDAMVEALRDRVAQHQTRANQLRKEMDDELSYVRRYEKALTALTGEVPVKPGPKPGRPRTSTSAGRPGGTRIGPEKLATLRKAVLRFAADHEEFRQIDFRSDPLGEGVSSGQSSALFDVLRQENVLRMARVNGNEKFYRLTREALGR
jgi:hypothetical protein